MPFAKPEKARPQGSLLFSASEIAKAKVRTILKARQLAAVDVKPGLATATHVVALMVRNERSRMAYFLGYYRDLGFDHFLVVDNDSTDGTDAYLADQPDVSVYQAEGSFIGSRFGMDWINTVLTRHCRDKWVLHVDADEFLSFPHCDEGGIRRLTGYLDGRGEASMNCLMLDMYSDRPVSENGCAEGEDPMSVCPLFDSRGYVAEYHEPSGTTWVKGGVRGRNYFQGRIWDGPALNKTPLVRWRAHHAFLKCAHQMWPFALNAGSQGEGRVTGVLLHAKFLADFVRKIDEESVRGQHSSEYLAYIAKAEDREKVLVGDETATYAGWRSLAEAGLIEGPGLMPREGAFSPRPTTA